MQVLERWWNGKLGRHEGAEWLSLERHGEQWRVIQLGPVGQERTSDYASEQEARANLDAVRRDGQQWRSIIGSWLWTADGQPVDW